MEKINVNEVELNGVIYIKKDTVSFTPIDTDTVKIAGDSFVRLSSLSKLAASVDGMPYVLVRTYSAGVHFGYLAEKNSTLAGVEVKLIKARRVYYWKGAATLSQMANDGVKNPTECKFTQAVESIDLLAIEIIAITEKASINLNKVAIWQM